LLKRWLIQWFRMPSGQTQEQKKRPNTSVPTKMTMDRISPEYTVQLVRKETMEMSGSISRKRVTSYPLMFLKSVIPSRRMKRRKKKVE
jgi:hypothetical protein